MKVGIVVKAKDANPFLQLSLSSCEWPRLVEEEGESVPGKTVDYRTYVAYERGASEDRTEESIEIVDSQVDWITTVPADERPDPAVVHANNDAVQAALDDGVDAIALLDADNYWVPHGLPMLVEGLVIGDADVVFGDHLRVHPAPLDQGREWVVSGWSNTPRTVEAGELIREPNKIAGNGLLARAEVWERVKWDPEMVGGWDVDWYVQVLSSGFTMKKIAEGLTPVVVCRQREDSMFAQSLPDGENEGESRWEEWRKQLARKSRDAREQAIESHFGTNENENEDDSQ